jgi:transposase InsO family protein
MSRQNYYARRQLRARRAIDGQLIAGLARQERCLQPRLGARKLKVLLSSALSQAGVKLGRDRFLEVLREHDLLLKPRRSETPHTTQSYHLLPVFKNLIKDRPASQSNEIWVADLTYLRTSEGFMFLSLLTDKVSRHIVGHHIDDSLESIGCQMALRMALKQLPEGTQPIHHSDRGSQYCCHEYVNMAAAAGVTMSMTEKDHCAENALAERMNGILKNEYGLDQRFKTKAQARYAAKQAIHLYGHRRPHSALAYRFPALVHSQLGSPLHPPAGCPTTGAPGARPEPRTGVRQTRLRSALLPVADHPVEPLRGE